MQSAASDMMASEQTFAALSTDDRLPLQLPLLQLDIASARFFHRSETSKTGRRL